ncbi:MAG: NADH-quinone oxidoreductase subunit J [Thermoplasmataceae archaeon]
MIYNIILIIFGIILAVFAAKAVSEKDILRAIIWLMIFLFTISASFIFMGATLIGSIELLVYVGAVTSLMVFTIMLTGGKEIE